MKRFLFSVDLEEFYTTDGYSDTSSTPIDSLVDLYLEFLERVGGQCTFFVVGEVARKFPELLLKIDGAGHELACHGDKHIPIDQLTPKSFYQDLLSNQNAVSDVIQKRPIGFRAPLMSVTKETDWVYEVLNSLEFAYSSSVIPTSTPLYGWPEFGRIEKRVGGVLEIPATLKSFAGKNVPFSCGTYFRLLPWMVLKPWYLETETVVGYFHPYDIDVKQRWTYQKELAGRPIMNHLLFINRKSLMAKLNQVIAMGYSIRTYSEFAAQYQSE